MRNKFMTHILSASALALVMGGTAYAQDPQYEGSQQDPTAQQDPAMQQEQRGFVDFANSYKSSSLQDLDVNDMEGQTIGKIDDVLIDSQGQASHVVVAEEGGLLGGAGQNYVIPWDQLQINDQEQTASVNVSQDQLSTEFSAFEELPATKLEHDQQQQPADDMGDSPDSQMQ